MGAPGLSGGSAGLTSAGLEWPGADGLGMTIRAARFVYRVRTLAGGAGGTGGTSGADESSSESGSSASAAAPIVIEPPRSIDELTRGCPQNRIIPPPATFASRTSRGRVKMRPPLLTAAVTTSAVIERTSIVPFQGGVDRHVFGRSPSGPGLYPDKAMKAALYTRYGPPDVLRIVDVDKPVPRDHQVLLQVRAASLNPLDWRMMAGRPVFTRLLFGLRPRVTPGRDVSGRVEAVGRSVTRFKPGDEVFGACAGALAEYACASESSLATKPANVTFEQAASVPVAGLTAVQGLRDHGRLVAGQKVLVNGAAGGVGTFAVQVARALGAEVTGVCSTRNLELVRSIGAARAIDYTREDFTRGETRYDLILDMAGSRPFPACRRVMTRNGVLVLAGGPKHLRTMLARALQGMAVSPFVSQRFTMFIARGSPTDLALLADLMAKGSITPVIDRCQPLGEAAAALAHLAAGHARGKVVITLEGRAGA